MQLLRSRQVKQVQAPEQPGGLAGWILEILRGWRRESRREPKVMRMIETLPLGGKRQLMLVSCEGELFLVGGGPESLETIVRVHSLARSEDLCDCSQRKQSERCG